jgi:hypothetical protein
VGLVFGCKLKVPIAVGWLGTPAPKAEVVPLEACGRDRLLDVPVALGVVGPDCGIGGSDSNKEVPKDDVGLNGLMPLKPVI